MAIKKLIVYIYTIFLDLTNYRIINLGFEFRNRNLTNRKNNQKIDRTKLFENFEIKIEVAENNKQQPTLEKTKR